MKVLAVLLLVGLAAGGGFGGEDWRMYKQWTTMKAMESCWGEENMKIYTVKLKTAIAKCYQKDAPELNLPLFKSPYRFINTLMTSADEMEQNQVMFLFKFMKSMMDMDNNSEKYMSHNFFDNHDYQVKPYSMDYNKDSWMEKMMKKMAMKKMMEKFMEKDNDNMDFDMYSNMKNEKYGNMFDFDSSDKFGSHSDFSAEKMMDALQSQMFEDKMKESMMKYKMQQMRRSDDDDTYDAYNPFTKASFRQRMSSLLNRQRRESDQSLGVSITLPESLDIGDRLAEKLKEEQESMENKIGNMTCVMREMGVLNQQNELDFTTQKRYFDKFNIPNKWLKNRLLNDIDVCNKVAQSLPYDYRQEENFPGLVNVGQIKSFMKCCKYSKMKTCMYKDVRKKLEDNFGSIEKILEQTQLTEDQLYPLVLELLHGDEMEYYY